MSRGKPTNRCRAFSLIELVIVVVIIAILGAIAIPRMSRGAAGAAESSLVGDLAVLRNAIDLYAVEHGGTFPTAANFAAQMTQFTDDSGATSTTKTATFKYGPYLRKVPPLPVGTTNKGETAILDAATGTLGAAGSGWFYNQDTGEIQANSTETDEAGDAYSTY